MCSYQSKVYRETDFTGYGNFIYDLLRVSGPLDAGQIASAVETAMKKRFPKSSATGRLKELRVAGKVYVTEPADGPKLYHAEADPECFERRKAEYQRTQELKAFADSAAYLKPYLPGTVVEDLRKKYAELKTAPL